jgi:hypothetical protein
VVVLVEGASDAAAVRVLCRARGIVESADTFAVVDMGGVTNIGRHLRALGLRDPSRRVLGVCDAPEERFFIRALQREGVEVETRADLEALGFVVCDRDLEDELIRALGPSRVEDALAELGDLDRFRTFQGQPEWRERPPAEQLHRFAGTRSGRKLVLAQRLASDLSPDETPSPLRLLVELIEQALLDRGVDGLMTDRPDILGSTLEQRGLWRDDA